MPLPKAKIVPISVPKKRYKSEKIRTQVRRPVPMERVLDLIPFSKSFEKLPVRKSESMDFTVLPEMETVPLSCMMRMFTE